jgi:hypothetical protein
MKSIFTGLCCSVLLFGFAAGVFAQSGTASQSERLSGVIKGIVVTENGIPVADAIVYLFEAARSPVTSTDEKGEFSFSNVPVGNHKVIAYKESAGFPNMLWSFYSETYEGKGMELVYVDGTQRVTNAVVKLGPEAGRLVIRVIDSDNGKSIGNAEVTMNRKGEPKTLLRSGANKPDGFDLLLPPNIPVEFSVAAPGYQVWHYRQRGIDSIRLSSGFERKITVELRR